MAETRRKFDADFKGGRGPAGPRDRETDRAGGQGPGDQLRDPGELGER
jgi:hypothetical protein